MFDKKIDYTELGGTMFVPATHKDLHTIASGKKYPNLKSVLIDTEDGILEKEVPHAISCIKNLLDSFEKSNTLVFIRPANIEVLKELLACTNSEKIDGFVLPKFSLSNAAQYLEILKSFSYAIMPSIEGEELFNHAKLFELRALLLEHKEKITLVRFGLEDMLRQLSMRRECTESVFDLSVTSAVLGNFIATFKSAGFAVSGGVYPCFQDSAGFIKDVQRDLKEGLFSKTIIHPNQIDIVHENYKVSQKDFDEACELCENPHAVFKQNGKMAEVVTMLPQTQEVIKRAKVYGIK